MKNVIFLFFFVVHKKNRSLNVSDANLHFYDTLVQASEPLLLSSIHYFSFNLFSCRWTTAHFCFPTQGGGPKRYPQISLLRVHEWLSGYFDWWFAYLQIFCWESYEEIKTGFLFLKCIVLFFLLIQRVVFVANWFIYKTLLCVLASYICSLIEIKNNDCYYLRLKDRMLLFAPFCAPSWQKSFSPPSAPGLEQAAEWLGNDRINFIKCFQIKTKNSWGQFHNM